MALLGSRDDQVNALAGLLIALVRQHGGELRIRTPLIESNHVGHLIEQDNSDPAYTLLRVREIPADMAVGLIAASRTLFDEVAMLEGAIDAAEPADPFVDVGDMPSPPGKR